MNFKNVQLILVILITAFSFNACTVTKKNAHKYLEKAEDRQYDIVIVPGVPFEEETWSRTMKGRLLWAVYLYEKGITKNIMFSGSSVYTPYVEAEIFAAYAEALGVNPENIYLEPLAEHSTENIYYGYKNARKLGFEKVALASDPFQTKMLKGFIKKKVDKSVGIIPIVNDSLNRFAKGINEPEVAYENLKVEDFISIKDREGFWKRFKGTQGKQIDTTAYSLNNDN